MRKNVFVILCHEQEFSSKGVPVLYDKGIPNHLKNNNSHIVIREIGSLEGVITEQKKKKINVIVVANENESLLTSHYCKAIFQRTEVTPHVICNSESTEKTVSIDEGKPLTDFFSLKKNQFPRKKPENLSDTWIRFFKEKSSSKTRSTPAGEQSLEEIPSTH